MLVLSLSEEVVRFRGFSMPRFPPSEAVVEMTYMGSCTRDARRGVLHVVGLPERVAAVWLMLPCCHRAARPWQAPVPTLTGVL